MRKTGNGVNNMDRRGCGGIEGGFSTDGINEPCAELAVRCKMSPASTLGILAAVGAAEVSMVPVTIIVVSRANRGCVGGDSLPTAGSPEKHRILMRLYCGRRWRCGK